MPVRRINPPDQGWLDRVKLGEPRVIPDWPEIPGVAVVVATRPPERRGPVWLFLVTSEQEADMLASAARGCQLWFVVSRHHLLKDGVVPDLQPGDLDVPDPGRGPAGGGDPPGHDPPG